LCRRLMEIGFTPGEYVRRAAASPFNDPIVVNIRGTSIALRRLEAGCIQIKLVADKVGT
jgi:ferrous iron transport protein A